MNTERGMFEKYKAVFSPSKAIEGLTHEQWLEKIPQVDAVVVLGSDLKREPDRESRLNLHGKMRTVAAYELYRLGKVKNIIVTGGVIEGHDRSMAAAEEEYLVNILGVDPSVVEKEIGEVSKNTIENFENIIEIIKDKNIGSAIIVSNGYHIPRAETLFKGIAKKHGISLKILSIPAEEILLERSPHYKKLVEHYDVAGKALTEHSKRLGRYIKKEGIGLLLAKLKLKI